MLISQPTSDGDHQDHKRYADDIATLLL